MFSNNDCARKGRLMELLLLSAQCTSYHRIVYAIYLTDKLKTCFSMSMILPYLETVKEGKL